MREVERRSMCVSKRKIYKEREKERKREREEERKREREKERKRGILDKLSENYR